MRRLRFGGLSGIPPLRRLAQNTTPRGTVRVLGVQGDGRRLRYRGNLCPGGAERAPGARSLSLENVALPAVTCRPYRGPGAASRWGRVGGRKVSLARGAEGRRHEREAPL